MIGTSSSGITAPMNINAVIAHLVEMTPPQRKQFAQMHMDDPMMLSAAKFVDNQISKQAAAMSAQQMGTAPPPVNPQVVAQMAPQPPAPQAAPMPQAAQQPQGQPMPEDTGIGQLPAPNMPSQYAAGGIVAFGVGGPVDPKLFAEFLEKSLGKTTSDFANALPQERAAIQQQYEAARSAANAGPQRVPVSAAPAQATAAAEQPGLGYRLGQATRQGLNRVGSFISEGMPRAGIGALAALTAGNENQNTREDEIMAAIHGEGYNGKPYNKKDAEALLKEMKVPGVKLKETPAAPAKPKDDRTKRDPKNYAPAEAAPKEKTGIDQLRADRVASAAPPSEPQPAAASPDYGTMYSDILKAQPDARASLPKEIGEIETLEKEQGNRELESVKKREQGLQALTAKREDRLAKREQALSQEEGLNPYMAMINAGLDMMQSTGKGLAGIAAGAKTGMGQFAEGVKLNTAQRQKINDARDALDDLRFNQETMSEKERNDAYNRIKQGAVATRTATVSFIQHRDDVNAKTAGHIFDARAHQALEGQRQQFQAKEGALDRQNRAAVASASAAVQERIAQMPGATERLYATLGGGDAKKGLAFYSQATAEGKGDEALLAALVKEPMLLSSLPKDLQDVVTNTLRARLVPPTVKAPPASQVRAP